MTTAFAKLFIIFTLAFEVLTITTGSVYYPIFSVIAGIAFGGFFLELLILKLIKMNKKCAIRRQIIMAHTNSF